jgi:capsular exopolysaccharide synthesis family protein
MQGRKVLLIDADLRKPDVARALGLPKGDCLVEALTDGRDPLECVVEADGISVLACGEPPQNSSELLSSPQMKDLINRAKERYDSVILDSAPVVGLADTKALSREVDTAILILRANSTDLEMALEAKEALAATGTQVLGFVLNQAHQRRAGYGYYKAYHPRVKADNGSH